MKNQHYSLPASINDSLKPPNPGKRAKRKKPMSSQAITFGQLIEERTRQASEGGAVPPSFNNEISALRGLMSDFAFTDNCTVGSHLRISYYKRLKEHITKLANQGRSKKYIANRKSLLGRWHSFINAMDKLSAADRGEPSPFQKMLGELLEQVPNLRKFALELNIPISTLRRWRNGSRLNARTAPMLKRLENYFGLERDVLADLSGLRPVVSAEGLRTVPAPIEYRERQKLEKRLYFRLNDVSDELRSQWRDFMVHKTEMLPFLERQPTGVWKRSRITDRRESERLWYCFLDGDYVATASLTWSHIASYLGWLSLPKMNGGAELPLESVQSLVWLLVPKYLNAYVQWYVKRSADKVHGGVIQFVKIVRSLSHPTTGYLTQSPQLANSAPAIGAITDWAEFCGQARGWAVKTVKTISRKEGSSRNPIEPISAVLELPIPMDAVSAMIQRMKVEYPATGGVYEAIASRDLVLIKLLASNPLRAKNLKLLTYKPDNSGQLYKTEQGEWRIHISKEHFKNQNGAAKHRDYDMPIDKSAWGDIERYIRVFRLQLPFANTLDYVFLPSFSGEVAGPWEGLNRRVETLTREYLLRCPGVGPHAFRYIMGTSILKASPNDWGTAALVLHDKEETVKKHYAHLRSSDGGTRMLNILSGSFARM